MKPRHQAYNAIEDSMMAAVRASMDTRARVMIDGVKSALKTDNFQEAHKYINDFTLAPAIKASRGKFMSLGLSALLFGASRTKAVKDVSHVKAGKVPAIVGLAINQLSNNLQHNVTKRIRAAALMLIGTAEDKHTKYVAMHKSDPEAAVLFKADMTAEELGEALQQAVMKGTSVASDISANLITSRLASYGFLAEAAADGTTTYKVSAILDDATCAVCEALDGTEFEVDKALTRVESTLSMDDPADLAVAAPWPDQSEASELDEADSQDLQDQGYDAPPFHPYCYAEGTKVYTKRGFIPFADVDVATDLFLSMDPKTGKPEWVRATEKQRYAFKGNMVGLDNGHGRMMLVTPDHRMFYSHRADTGNMGRQHKFVFGDMAAFTKSPENWLYQSSKHEGFSPETVDLGFRHMPTTGLTRFMGWYLSEGYICTRTSLPIICQQKPENKQEVEDCARGIKRFASWWGDDKCVIRDGQLGVWLKQFGKAHEKWIPDFIFDLSQDDIRVFLAAYAKGDGHTRTRKAFGYESEEVVISTSSVRMRDQLVELFIRAGYGARYTLLAAKGKVTKHHNGSYACNYDQWVVSRQHSVMRKVKPVSVPYDGEVFDVTLERNHTLLVEYEGKIVWGSNCRCILVSADEAATDEAVPFFDDLFPTEAEETEAETEEEEGEGKPEEEEGETEGEEEREESDEVEGADDATITFEEFEDMDDEERAQAIADGDAPSGWENLVE